jgi:hypothetical protein
MQRKAVSSDEVDPGLNHGYSYIVEEKAYKAWLATATPHPDPEVLKPNPFLDYSN